MSFYGIYHSRFGDNENAATGYYAGKITGDIVSAIRGAGEIFTGGGMITGGGTISITGFGATVGVPAAVAGAALVGHGIGSLNSMVGSRLNLINLLKRKEDKYEFSSQFIV